MDELHTAMGMSAALACIQVLGAACFLAFEEAAEDAYSIEHGLPIDHVEGWAFRAAAMGLVVGLISMGVDLWMTVPLLGIAGAAFSSVFRYRLNAIRGKDWRYIAPWSNYYDRLFYRVWMFVYAGLVISRWHWQPRESIEDTMRMYAAGWEESTNDIHRAGLLAYIVEAITAIACIVWAVV